MLAGTGDDKASLADAQSREAKTTKRDGSGASNGREMGDSAAELQQLHRHHDDGAGLTVAVPDMDGARSPSFHSRQGKTYLKTPQTQRLLTVDSARCGRLHHTFPRACL